MRIVILSDADIVKVRQAARALAERAGFGRTDQTVIATAVSEVARNIVRFADAGEATVDACAAHHRDRRSGGCPADRRRRCAQDAQQAAARPVRSRSTTGR